VEKAVGEETTDATSVCGVLDVEPSTETWEPGMLAVGVCKRV